MPAIPTLCLRYSGAILVAAVIAFIGGIPLATTAWWTAPVLLIPLAVGVWAWRAGTDAGPDGLRLRAAIGSRRIEWGDIAELTVDAKGRVVARLNSGATIALPAVTAKDLPRLVAVSDLGTAPAGMAPTGTATDQ